MQPWFMKEGDVLPFPKKDDKVIKLPNVGSYPNFLAGVEDLQSRVKKGELSDEMYKRLYTELLHRFMRRESAETPWFMVENNFLFEAVGISGRKPGDIFQNLKNPKDEISFELFKPYPDNKMKFENVEEMSKEIARIQKKIPNLIQVNQPNKSQLAFGLAVFNSKKEKLGFIKFGKDVQQVNNPGWWKNDAIPGYQPYFKSAKKVSSGFDPKSIFSTGTSKSTPFTTKDVIKKINDKLGSEFSQPVAEIVSKKILPTFKNQKENETAIRDNFGEVFGPIALMSNAQGVTGPFKEAEKYLGQPFSSCKIFYPTQQTNPLTDSYLLAPNGKEMGISSKGKRGANASINSLAKNIIKLKETDPKNPLLKKYKFTVDILTFLNEADYINGPIDLAEKIKLINANTAQEIKKLWQPKSEEKDIRKYPKLRKIYNLYPFDRGPEDKNFRLRFAVLANIAKAVAEKVNNTKGFGEGALNFLNQSQIIQAYTQTISKDNDVVVSEIKTIYPPNFQGILILNGGKNYYSTNAVGKIAFDFKPV